MMKHSEGYCHQNSPWFRHIADREEIGVMGKARIRDKTDTE